MQDSCALREVKKKKENISSINMGSQSSMNKYPGRHGQYEMSSRGKDAFLIEKNNNCVDVSVYMYRKYSSKKKKCNFPENNSKDLFITERSLTEKWLARLYALFLFTSYYQLP